VEVLPEIGDAAGEWRSAHVDDPRVRQHQVDEAQMQEVVALLVDEVRPAEQTVRTSLHQVALAERGELRAREPPE
jgi:hypothetical protein